MPNSFISSNYVQKHKKISVKPVKGVHILERNEICYCGSKKKFKKCCINKPLKDSVKKR